MQVNLTDIMAIGDFALTTLAEHHKERNGESRKSQESQTKSQHRKKIANGGRGWVGETNQREESDRTMTDRMQVREPPVPVPMRDRE
jgi:hypothetical protein